MVDTKYNKNLFETIIIKETSFGPCFKQNTISKVSFINYLKINRSKHGTHFKSLKLKNSKDTKRKQF